MLLVEFLRLLQKRLTSTNPEHLCKPELQKRAFVGALADGLLNSDKERWSRGRKLVSRAFTYKALQSNVPYMCSIGRILVENLEKRCPNGGSFEGDDVWRMLHFYGIKIVARTWLLKFLDVNIPNKHRHNVAYN